MPKNRLEFQSSSRHNYRCAADANLFDATGLALNFETDAAWAIDEVALFDHETIDAVGSFDARRVMIDQVTAQRPSGAAGGGIFADILSDEKSRVGACFARRPLVPAPPGPHNAGRVSPPRVPGRNPVVLPSHDFAARLPSACWTEGP